MNLRNPTKLLLELFLGALFIAGCLMMPIIFLDEILIYFGVK